MMRVEPGFYRHYKGGMVRPTEMFNEQVMDGNWMVWRFERVREEKGENA